MGGLGVARAGARGDRVARARGRRARARARPAARQPPHRLARLLAAQRQRRAGRARDRGHDDADARLAASRRARASPQSGVGAAFTRRRRRGLRSRRSRSRASPTGSTGSRLVGLGTLLLAPCLGAMALPLGTAAFVAAMVACGIAQSIGFVGRVSARRRRRRARRRRPGRRDGPALRQLGRRRADRPGARPARWPSSRTTPPRSRSRARWRWRRPSACAGARAGERLYSPLDPRPTPAQQRPKRSSSSR